MYVGVYNLTFRFVCVYLTLTEKEQTDDILKNEIIKVSPLYGLNSHPLPRSSSLSTTKHPPELNEK